MTLPWFPIWPKNWTRTTSRSIDTADEWEDQEPGTQAASRAERDAIAQEIEELRHFKMLATNIRDNAKGKALLTALDRAFAELERLGAAKKAIIFTESRRTQEYLLGLLADTPYGDGIVLFNGTNSDARAQATYKDWLKRHKGTDRITGSKTADTRAALVEHFKERGKLMIATEAGAEGINLQFCSLVINYDLPWNPQRIEQRIGRCHRYGQKFDVVVVNFVDRSNEADARVYELLDQKFQLFEGVFGASDEVLGAIGSGVDFERRIADIYQNCREPAQIRASFEQLQLDLSGEISEAMVKTRQLLLENFDEQVQEKLRVRAEDSRAARSKYERMLMDLTRAELADCASFDAHGFVLHGRPGNAAGSIDADAIPSGRYELPRRSGEAHLYRLGHPLAEWVVHRAKARDLPNARLLFDYDAHGTQISTLKAYRGQTGWLTLALLEVTALENQEQHLLVAASTRNGVALAEDDPEKLLRLPATLLPARPVRRCRRRPAGRRGSPQGRPAARHPSAQPWLLRAGSPEAGRLGGRPEAGPGAGDQGDRPRDQGSPPHCRYLADAGRKAVMAEEAARAGRQAQQAAPRAVRPAGRSRSAAQRPDQSVGGAAPAAGRRAHAVHGRVGVEMKKQTLVVQGAEVAIVSRHEKDFISLTDMVRKFGDESILYNWLRNRNTIEFLGIWEQIYNPAFKPLEFERFKNQAGLNSFALSPKKWIEATGAIGLYAKSGRGGGTFAHRDIAFEFGSWLSPEFKLYLIREFQRLKDEESRSQALEWNFQRTLAKVNYKIHTDAIKERLIPPRLTKAQTSMSRSSGSWCND